MLNFQRLFPSMLGYEGNECFYDVRECASSPCLNNGECIENMPGHFYCSCQAGFEGNLCQYNKDDCASNPCGENSVYCHDKVAAYTWVRRVFYYSNFSLPDF